MVMEIGTKTGQKWQERVVWGHFVHEFLKIVSFALNQVTIAMGEESNSNVEF
jgi:hypothetical protein